ncbi:MAG: endo-1,4-beta-xylanase, partial [Victivallaceae bacterium]
MDFKKFDSAMSDAYWQLWNDDEQAKISADIEANRKADANFELPDAAAKTEVKVEQITHEFIFGAHIFNFDQLGKDEYNSRYKQLYGELFNSATIAFYWKKFELEAGNPRFKGEFRDTAEFWNTVPEPWNQPHWRRPASDPVVEFCESKKIRLHGHPLVWGNNKWHYPEWLLKKLPLPFRNSISDTIDTDANITNQIFDAFTPEQLEKLLPEFVSEINSQMAKHIFDIALHYRGRIHSWDVCNESCWDFKENKIIPESGICKSTYGLMPGDYTYRSFKLADAIFPKSVKLNINDYYLQQEYADQVKELTGRGCKIDIVGAQMHLFRPQQVLDIADGVSDAQSPENVRRALGFLSQTKRPIHLSEITITSPDNSERGLAIQAVMLRNLYRLWFSWKDMMGITWWNVVDNCGAPGEPSYSGIFTRDMQPKLSYFVMDDLLNHQWKTNLELTSGQSGEISFRGF